MGSAHAFRVCAFGSKPRTRIPAAMCAMCLRTTHTTPCASVALMAVHVAKWLHGSQAGTIVNGKKVCPKSPTKPERAGTCGSRNAPCTHARLGMPDSLPTDGCGMRHAQAEAGSHVGRA